MSSRDQEDTRPNPDQLLHLIQKNEQKDQQGNLKIFLGMVAGVGKTFAMLQRAHQLKSQGVDVVIGWIDTHGRKETESLVSGLEVIPRKSIPYKDVAVAEMDIDAILLRKPKVVIVDELAHTNIPGQRHSKRYLDVLELLKAGIDVYTAVNVQHLASRVDTVKDITGITIHETVPDSILDQADEIVLIDLPPEDLLLRLKEGRIYSSEKIDTAGKNFFKMGNLTALRELVLRVVSDRVDKDLRDYKTLHGIEEAWKSSSRLMVAVFSSPYSDSLIRWTRQLADTMKGSWVGVYVDRGKAPQGKEKELLEKNAELVRQLGGEFLTIQDPSLVDGLLKVAKRQNVTQIIVGKTQRNFLQSIFSGGSIVQKLLRKSGDIDVYVVATDKGKPLEHKKIPKNYTFNLFPWGEFGWVTAVTILSWLLAGFLSSVIGYSSIGIIFLMAVTLSGLVLSRPSVLTLAVLLSLIHNFFFIPPVYAFNIDKPEDILMFIMYFLAASTVGHLTNKLKMQNKMIQNREDKTNLLFRITRQISESQDLTSIMNLAAEELGKKSYGEVCIILFENDKPAIHPASTFYPEEKEQAVATWIKNNDSVAGRYTETLPASEGIYFPIHSRGKVVGVLGINFPKDYKLDFEEKNFIYTLVNQFASGIERELLHESRKKLEFLERSEKLQRSLFDSVSHELKTPLTTIKAAASALTEEESSKAVVRDLAVQISEESERLLKVVDNMLDMTRIESGTLKPHITIVDIADILGPSLKQVGASDKVITQVGENLPGIKCDVSLVVQTLTNIIRNALFYSHDKVEVLVSTVSGHKIQIEVIDKGPGLPKKDPNQVFQKFYREQPNKSGGMGLGLSIAKSFIEIQGGTLAASNSPEGGAVFTITLPAE